MARKELSRFEVNKEARRILASNSVDMRSVQISASSRTINLSGSLTKDPSGELSAQTVSNITKELHSIPGITSVTSDLDNWDISGDSIKSKEKKKTQKEK